VVFTTFPLILIDGGSKGNFRCSNFLEKFRMGKITAFGLLKEKGSRKSSQSLIYCFLMCNLREL
jgi:hypothetical protein